MKNDKLIELHQLCTHYEVEMSFFTQLQDVGIIEIRAHEDSYVIHEDKLAMVEKVVRIKNDLNINPEGIDTVLNLLDKIDDLQSELTTVRNRLRLYEE